MINNVKDKVRVTIQLNGQQFRSRDVELTRNVAGSFGAGMKIVNSNGEKSVATSKIEYDLIELMEVVNDLAKGDKVVGVATTRIGDYDNETESTVVGSKPGYFRPKDVIERNAIAPKDSELLTSLSTMELVNLAELMNTTMTKGILPIVVTLKKDKDNGLRYVVNAFPGCFRTEELLAYMKERLGPMMTRFENL